MSDCSLLAHFVKGDCPAILRESLERLSVEFRQGLFIMSAQDQRLADRGVYGDPLRNQFEQLPKGGRGFVILPGPQQSVTQPPIGFPRERIESDALLAGANP